MYVLCMDTLNGIYSCAGLKYAIESQVNLHGLNPSDTIIQVYPREGEHTLRTEDILSKIREHGHEVALVLFSGVQYYTGQFFDIEKITQAGHERV